MKVTHFNTLAEGGAAKAAMRLHDGLTHAGVDSLFVRAKSGPVRSGVHEVSNPVAVPALLVRCLRKFRRWRDARNMQGRKLSTYLSAPQSAYTPADFEGLRQPDVYNLHWTAGFLDWDSMLPWMAAQAPLVWTLHDINPFSGIWHYVPELGDWTPALRRRDERVRVLKQRVLDGLPENRLTIIGPSRWICEDARKSPLMRRFDIRHIPNGVDIDVFQPIEKRTARQALGLPMDARIVGFAADYLVDKRKGSHFVSSALELARTPRIIPLLVGACPRTHKPTSGAVHLGRLESERLMALFYNALDLFVCPSLQDNLPNTVLESLACGTPVIGFDTGGISDMVRPDMTGWMVPPGSVQGLAEAFDVAFSDPLNLAAMRARCRKVAVVEYSLAVQAAAYANLYHELLQAGPLR